MIQNFAQAGKSLPRIAVVIPCFRVRSRILWVLDRIDDTVETIYVVDDCCPEQSGQYVQQEGRDPRIRVLFNATNQGVGGAVTAGMAAAIQDGMDVLIKVDGDGQMDPTLIPLFVKPILEGDADVTKGNRFYYLDDAQSMPIVRLLGNAMLSFLTKLSSGYWNVFDPTNGYVAWDCRLLAALHLEKVDRRYFFESDMLFRVGLLRAKVLDIPMTAVYDQEKSNMNVWKEIMPFFVRNTRNFLKRIFYNYFLRDFNVASLEIALGLACSVFGIVYGITHWGIDRPATPGTVMIAALPLLTGIILLVSFVNFDVQQVPRERISPRLSHRVADPASAGVGVAALAHEKQP
jgi:glycosyltransferase involved in cell wall biosynthesis